MQLGTQQHSVLCGRKQLRTRKPLSRLCEQPKFVLAKSSRKLVGNKTDPLQSILKPLQKQLLKHGLLASPLLQL